MRAHHPHLYALPGRSVIAAANPPVFACQRTQNSPFFCLVDHEILPLAPCVTLFLRGSSSRLLPRKKKQGGGVGSCRFATDCLPLNKR